MLQFIPASFSNRFRVSRKRSTLDRTPRTWSIILTLAIRQPLIQIRKFIVPAAMIIALTVGVLFFRFNQSGRALLRDFSSPAITTGDRVESEVSDRVRMLQSKVELIQEITRLEHERVEDAVRLARLDELQRLNSELKKQLHLTIQLPVEMVHARVIVRDAATGGRRLQINRGAAYGIAIGQPVLAGRFLLGRVVEVSHHLAYVQTVADANCHVSVRPVGTRCSGILAGTPDLSSKVRPVIQVRHLQMDCDIRKGQIIETSDHSIAPPGIKVGVVLDPADGPQGNERPDRTCTIRPYVYDQPFTHVTVLVQRDAREL